MLNDQPQPEIARSAVILGEIHVGAGESWPRAWWCERTAPR